MAGALELLMAHHEPYPVVIIDHAYEVLDLNVGARAIVSAVLGLPPLDPALSGDDIAALGMNLARLTFDPAGAQPYLVNFDDVGRHLLWRLHREVLADPEDDALRSLLDELLAMPTVGDTWREVDLTVPSDPLVFLHLRRGEVDLRFLTTITAFQAPQHVAVERLRIETWFPVDEVTAATCRRLGGETSG